MHAPVHLSDRCICCEHPISVVSDPALVAASDEHRLYVATVLDQRTDPHFLDQRLTALMIT